MYSQRHKKLLLETHHSESLNFYSHRSLIVSQHLINYLIRTLSPQSLPFKKIIFRGTQLNAVTTAVKVFRRLRKVFEDEREASRAEEAKRPGINRKIGITLINNKAVSLFAAH